MQATGWCAAPEDFVEIPSSKVHHERKGYHPLYKPPITVCVKMQRRNEELGYFNKLVRESKRFVSARTPLYYLFSNNAVSYNYIKAKDNIDAVFETAKLLLHKRK